jgi:hypothetical protein
MICTLVSVMLCELSTVDIKRLLNITYIKRQFYALHFINVNVFGMLIHKNKVKCSLHGGNAEAYMYLYIG